MDFENLPKIELHCHLDGSIRPQTVIDIAMKENIELPSYDHNIIKRALIAPTECNSLDDYLRCFDIPIAVMQSKESLERTAFELVEDAALENVKYIEVRFAPVLHTRKGLKLKEIIECVLTGMKRAEKLFDIKSNLILSCLRVIPVKAAFETIEAGKEFLGKGVVAIDLCASEDEGFSMKFEESIALAREYGYNVTIHAGETGIGKNVLEAVTLLKATRIGHGVFIHNCKEAYDIVKKQNIFLEMCPTSNIQTKAAKSIIEHPIYKFYKDDIKVTINTDNRTVSDTNLTKEHIIVFNNFHISYEEYKTFYLNSVDASFTNQATKELLRTYVK